MDLSSLENNVKWKASLDESELFPDGKKLPNILIQNKADLINEDELKDMSKLEEFSKKMNLMPALKPRQKPDIILMNLWIN